MPRSCGSAVTGRQARHPVFPPRACAHPAGCGTTSRFHIALCRPLTARFPFRIIPLTKLEFQDGDGGRWSRAKYRVGNASVDPARWRLAMDRNCHVTGAASASHSGKKSGGAAGSSDPVQNRDWWPETPGPPPTCAVNSNRTRASQTISISKPSGIFADYVNYGYCYSRSFFTGVSREHQFGFGIWSGRAERWCRADHLLELAWRTNLMTSNPRICPRHEASLSTV